MDLCFQNTYAASKTLAVCTWSGPKCLKIGNFLVDSCVGPNPNIMKFEPLWTWQVEHQTHSNPGLSTKTELWTNSNTSKKLKFRTCSARIRPNPGLNLEKLNFQPFWTHVHLPKLKYEPSRTLQKSRTLNPCFGFDPIRIVERTALFFIYLKCISQLLQKQNTVL